MHLERRSQVLSRKGQEQEKDTETRLETVEYLVDAGSGSKSRSLVTSPFIESRRILLAPCVEASVTE